MLLDPAVALGLGVNYLHARRMSYSIGLILPDDTADLLKLIPTARGQLIAGGTCVAARR